jgi:hypothetical protein
MIAPKGYKGLVDEAVVWIVASLFLSYRLEVIMLAEKSKIEGSEHNESGLAASLAWKPWKEHFKLSALYWKSTFGTRHWKGQECVMDCINIKTHRANNHTHMSMINSCLTPPQPRLF